MSSYDKLIKQATKPRAKAPKAKYMDPIIASSFSQDGTLQDMCRALSHRLQESDSVVVFRSLLVVHTMIRNGGVNNVLTILSSGQGNLRLKNVIQGGNWQGHEAPRMLPPYATYLEERIKAFRELRHDVIRAAESQGRSGSRTTDRSEGAESGQRLRKMTVEKGLLREVGVCQKVCSRLLDVCFTYFSSNVDEELPLTAFRMSLKDLLAIYAAINEGVINVLEHYFEMSKVDATSALDIYKRFCVHTEKIVAYLAQARKMSSALNMTVPNLRHAPVSLAGALREYLEDPNFEKNRQEYKENKRIADGGSKAVSAKKDVSGSVPASSSKKSITIQEPTAEEKTKPVKPVTSNQALSDFFESIETEQMSMFGQNAQQQGFVMPQATGFQPHMPFMQPQMTGYNPFFGQQQAVAPFLQSQQGVYMQPQITGFAPGGFLQPQMTSAMANPFRQSVFPQQSAFGGQAPATAFAGQQMSQSNASGGTDAFNAAFQNGNTLVTSPAPTEDKETPTSASVTGSVTAASGQTRSASAPLIAQKTGSRNPFAPPPGSTPQIPKPVPSAKGPTLFELAFGGAQGPTAGGGGNYGLGSGAWNGSQQVTPSTNVASPPQMTLVPQKTGLIGSIASEFVDANASSASSGNASSAFATSSTTGLASPSPASNATAPIELANGFAGMTLSPYGHTNGNGSGGASTTPSAAVPIQAQPTGFGGSLVKPFVPESSFGQSLAANGGAPAPAPIPANMTGNPFARLAASSSGPASASAVTNSSANGPTLTSNTFTAPSPLPDFSSANSFSNGNAFAAGYQQTSKAFGGDTSSNSAPNQSFNNSNAALGSQPTGFAGSTMKPFQPSSAFGTVTFGNGLVQPAQQQQKYPQQQQPGAVTGTLF